jgi:thiol:disulfide interchange protein
MTSRTHCPFPALVVAVALLATAGACASKWKPATTPTPPPAAAPAAAASPTAQPPLTGLVTRAAVESFNDVWKGLRAQDYQPEPSAVSTIRTNANDVEVFAVVATWCPDTRRDLPRFFKIADQARWSMKKVKLLAVDRTKKDAGGLTDKWNVTRVPTFIFIRGGREIGRVVEKPATTLEQDIAAIVGRR